MKIKAVAATILIYLLCALPFAAKGKLYTYTDEKGLNHFTRYPDHVLPQYQKSVQLANPNYKIKSRAGAELAEKISPTTRANWIIADTHDYALGVRIGRVLIHCSIESLFAFWAVLEIVLLLTVFKKFLRARKRFYQESGFLGSYRSPLVYSIIALAVLLVFVLPSYRDFLESSQDHLAVIYEAALPDNGARRLIFYWDHRLEKSRDQWYVP